MMPSYLFIELKTNFTKLYIHFHTKCYQIIWVWFCYAWRLWFFMYINPDTNVHSHTMKYIRGEIEMIQSINFNFICFQVVGIKRNCMYDLLMMMYLSTHDVCSIYAPVMYRYYTILCKSARSEPPCLTVEIK